MDFGFKNFGAIVDNLPVVKEAVKLAILVTTEILKAFIQVGLFISFFSLTVLMEAVEGFLGGALNVVIDLATLTVRFFIDGRTTRTVPPI